MFIRPNSVTVNYKGYTEIMSSKNQVTPSEPVLLTPGPLTTSAAVKQAMLRDLGSRDSEFIELNKRVCESLLEICNASTSHRCVPVQGSGTFAVEAMIGTLVPAKGKILNLVNGAYGKRISEICRYLGREYIEVVVPENQELEANAVKQALKTNSGITHVCMVYCETTSGILNPLNEISQVVSEHGCSLLLDAMSAFGALKIDLSNTVIDAVAASSNKCLQGVPGMGFVVVKNEVLRESKGNSHSLALDLREQYKSMKSNGQWRFTPPVHCLLALDCALQELQVEGGVSQRRRRYKENCQILRDGMRALGFKTYLSEKSQAPIIVTFFKPPHPAFDFEVFYRSLSEKGFVIYPGKITKADTFRVGCIGAIGSNEMHGFISAVQSTLSELGMEDLTSMS